MGEAWVRTKVRVWMPEPWVEELELKVRTRLLGAREGRNKAGSRAEPRLGAGQDLGCSREIENLWVYIC